MCVFANPALIKSDQNHYFSLIFWLINHKISRKPETRAVSASLMMCFMYTPRKKFINNKKQINPIRPRGGSIRSPPSLILKFCYEAVKPQ